MGTILKISEWVWMDRSGHLYVILKDPMFGDIIQLYDCVYLEVEGVIEDIPTNWECLGAL